jgi:hypothetical protein
LSFDAQAERLRRSRQPYENSRRLAVARKQGGAIGLIGPASREEKARKMTINFPNRSRSYDATRRAVRFWEYDRSMESSFFVTADALKQIQPDLQSDAVDLLRAFDINRERIYAIAAKVYARGRRGSYDLNVADV